MFITDTCRECQLRQCLCVCASVVVHEPFVEKKTWRSRKIDSDVRDAGTCRREDRRKNLPSKVVSSSKTLKIVKKDAKKLTAQM